MSNSRGLMCLFQIPIDITWLDLPTVPIVLLQAEHVSADELACNDRTLLFTLLSRLAACKILWAPFGVNVQIPTFAALNLLLQTAKSPSLEGVQALKTREWSFSDSLKPEVEKTKEELEAEEKKEQEEDEKMDPMQEANLNELVDFLASEKGHELYPDVVSCFFIDDAHYPTKGCFETLQTTLLSMIGSLLYPNCFSCNTKGRSPYLASRARVNGVQNAFLRKNLTPQTLQSLLGGEIIMKPNQTFEFQILNHNASFPASIFMTSSCSFFVKENQNENELENKNGENRNRKGVVRSKQLVFQHIYGMIDKL